MYLIFNHQIYPEIVRMMNLGKSDSQRRTNTKHAVILYTYSENDILINSSYILQTFWWSSVNPDILGNGSWYPQINLMTLRNFWMYPPEVCWYPRILEHTRCFMMIPSENYFSENSDPQRLFYPSETVMVSAKTKFPSDSKSDILQNAPFYPLNMLPCCSFSFKQFLSCTSKKSWKLSWCTFRIFWLPQELSLDIGYMWISCENSDDILTQSDGIFPQTQ